MRRWLSTAPARPSPSIPTRFDVPDNRALAVREGDVVLWFWIGTYADYDQLLRQFVPGSTSLLVAGGLLSASGAYTFIYNLWRTIDGSAVARHDPAGVSATIALGRRSASRP